MEYIFLLVCLAFVCIVVSLSNSIQKLEHTNKKLWEHAIHMEFLLKKHDLWFDTSAESDLEDEEEPADSLDQ